MLTEASPDLRAVRTMTIAQRETFDEQGYLVVPNALSPGRVDRLTDALDRVYGVETASGRVRPGQPLHLFAFVLRDDRFLDLLDLPSTFPLVWGTLGWNIHMYHSHLDVHPPVREDEPPAWGWHQDGGRQNLEIETQPVRPRLSVKLGYFLSDVSEPGRGNLMVVPGSHRRNAIPRPEEPHRGFEPPEGAVPVLAEPGTAVLFDRRLWHTRSPNRSPLTRMALFTGYTYRWIRPRDDYPMDPRWFAGLSPVRRQLLGAGASAMDHWGLGEDEVPLRAWLRVRGLLDPVVPSNR
jgi:ectoine hydroxylase-related dioxygenase (phytanoyl-CoA dioxygenase family)